MPTILMESTIRPDTKTESGSCQRGWRKAFKESLTFDVQPLLALQLYIAGLWYFLSASGCCFPTFKYSTSKVIRKGNESERKFSGLQLGVEVQQESIANIQLDSSVVATMA